MEITSVRLLAKSPLANPRVLIIPARFNEEFLLGRANFLTADNGIISRRHARFNIVGVERERLVVCNLSAINGLLVNFRPVALDQDVTLYNGDEIVALLRANG